ncbi:hypothetical protein [Mycolicibacterium lutetiense]|uniref:Uncharacterized protein n=1 Tax=Mycolicibacterium lutetiense TaxID=1641992 RepID=A0ABS4ZU90_9MYCO|nr:hypothetical protein [Mycolicibacterium lutetiense]MBP2452995.1 hypothetical protein [Mycolicibacterium lutetiense]
MSRPAPEVPVRRRPIPPFRSVDEIKRVVEYPYFLRYLLVVGAVLFAVVFPWALYAVVVRERGPDTIVTIVFVVALATVVVGSRLMPPILIRRFYDRVMRGGVLCDVYPAGFPDAQAAILIDTRLSDAQAAYVHDAIATWLGRSAADPAVQAQAGGLFADGPIRSADELAGPGARGGFLVARDKNPDQGWRLILPETNPRDPLRPYSNGVVVQVNTPSLESAGQ